MFAIIFLLGVCSSTNAFATQKKVGLLASPTAFAKIHFFRSPLSLDDIAEDVDNFLMNATATATALGAPANIINQLNGFKGKVHSQFAKSTKTPNLNVSRGLHR